MVKVPILQHLESLRDEELEERREKRRRQLAEEEESKQNERRASGAEQTREQSLQVNNCGICISETTVTEYFDPLSFTTRSFKFYFLQGSGLGTINGSENTAGTVSVVFFLFSLSQILQ